MSRLHTIQAGNGPVLIMLHGLFGSVDNFRTVAQTLQQKFRVVRIDLPGHGQSPGLPSLSLEAMADTVLDEIQDLGATQFHLLGHSLGGKVAMCIAGNPRCKNLDKLIIVDIAPKEYPPHHREILAALQAIDLQTLSSRSDAEKQLSEAVSDAGVRSFLLKSLDRHEHTSYRWRFDLQQLAADYPLISRSPDIKETIEQPTLFIKGADSDYLQAADEPMIRTKFTQPSVKVMLGTGHWPHAEKPEQFVRICEQHLDAPEIAH